jgi:hypothetical protein
MNRLLLLSAAAVLLAGPAAADVRFTFSGTFDHGPTLYDPLSDELADALGAGPGARWTAMFLLDEAGGPQFTPLAAELEFGGRTFNGDIVSVLAGRHDLGFHFRAPAPFDAVPGNEYIYLNLDFHFAANQGVYPITDPDFYLNVPPAYDSYLGSTAELILSTFPTANSITFQTTAYGAPYRSAVDRVTIEGEFPPAPVPEPAAWVAMLLGFGGLGALLRRRRAAEA